MSAGPLRGLRVVEIAAIGPAPFAAMVLADLGADVIRVDRVEAVGVDSPHPRLLGRSRRSVGVDLKHREGIGLVLDLAAGADGLIEGFRPGVMERLGLGPDPCLERNGRLVYGRVTGWGQEGPLAQTAGHDIDYIALAGALDPIGGPGGHPVPPLNLVGDFGGGGMLLALGMVCGMLESARSGRGQVVDAAMVDGAALQMTLIHQMRGIGEWIDERGANSLDGGAPFYAVYETADGEHVAVGALEPQFYAELISRLELEDSESTPQRDRTGWPASRQRMDEVFRSKTRAEWCEIFAGSDACFAPVLSMAEAPNHPHNRERQTFREVDGIVEPAPAPRFSRTPGEISRPPARPGEHTSEALVDWGLDEDQIERLRAAGAVA